MSTLVPEMSALQSPYLFRDYQHVYAALDGSDTLRKYYDGVLDKKGFKLVGFIAAGYRGHLRPLPDQLDRRREGQED